MEIKSTTEDTFDLSYKDDTFEDLLDDFKNNANQPHHHLSLFLGLYRPNKKKALQKISEATGLKIKSLDLNDYISKSVSETKENLNRVFNKYSNENSVLYFDNGDKLCGVYTGFSHSHVKYASPQERYFLKLVQDFEGIVIVNISEYTAADKTIRRAAQSIVRFDLPKSKLQRFMWHLKNYTLHGFELKSKRPDSYGEPIGQASRPATKTSKS